MLLLLLSAFASGLPENPDVDPADGATTLKEEAFSLIGPGYRGVAPWLDEEVLTAMHTRKWRDVSSLLEKRVPRDASRQSLAEHAFLRAWALIRAKKPADAAPLLPKFEGAVTIPAPYRDLVRGEVLLAADKTTEALKALQAVPSDSPIYSRAAVLVGNTLNELSRSSEAYESYTEMAKRSDPAPGNALALMAVAQHHGVGSEKAYPALRRLWTWYPETAQGIKAGTFLARYGKTPAFQPTAEEWSIRAERWMRVRSYDKAIQASNRALGVGKAKDEATCRALYTKGRSYYKKNQLSNSISGFSDAGTRCEGVAEAYGAKSLYLKGTAEFRRKAMVSSARTFEQIPQRYPSHSMADDGYTHAGISLLEHGDLPGAQAMWAKALESFPNGDTAAEATWRSAFASYLDGRPEDARRIAQALAQLDPSVDAIHSDAGRYWHARWAMYPDVSNPTVAVESGKADAVAGWEALLVERPFSFYAILAASRLAEVAPEVLAKHQTRAERGALSRNWRVRTAFIEHEGIRHGAAMARLGLHREAASEWERFDEELIPDEKAWLIELRSAAGDWLMAHAAFRSWIRSHPVGSLGEDERAVVRVAYPDRYWENVQAASKEYNTYEPRLFHALMREESNFNRKIVSFAGARGLSQLMPATAKQTAGWMGRSITMTELFEPQKNLDIGGRYLHQVHKQLSGSSYCALAGYNAGPGRVFQWKGEWGNIPTDEYVERIPFRETRGYVKRVMGTWQTFRWFMDDGEPFPDLSKYNHEVLP